MDGLIWVILILCGGIYAAFNILGIIDFLHTLAKILLHILTFGKVTTEEDIFSGHYFQVRRNEKGTIILGSGYGIVLGFILLSIILGITIMIGKMIFF